ncbi:unnamed protein product [Soboliphyme baturini]|uniref:Uncharacterized protein n=1 Tax=Soboliphyme baturini TaxID=241478 RepID=A0A183IEH6_9BILA|nr:unnamed protein product [Soboliphyme baturini]
MIGGLNVLRDCEVAHVPPGYENQIVPVASLALATFERSDVRVLLHDVQQLRFEIVTFDGHGAGATQSATQSRAEEAATAAAAAAAAAALLLLLRRQELLLLLLLLSLSHCLPHGVSAQFACVPVGRKCEHLPY